MSDDIDADIDEMQLGTEISKTVVVRVFLAVFGFAGTIVFARVLGPVGFGGYYFLLTIVQVLDRPFRGWTVGVEKRFSEYDAGREEIVGATVLFNLVGLAVVAVLAIAFEPQLVERTQLEGSGVLLVLLLGPLVFFSPFEQLVAATGRVALTNAVDALRSVLTLAFQLAFVLLVGLGAAGMAYGLSGATVIGAAINVYLLGTAPRLPSRETLRSIASFARYAVLTSILGKTYSRLDTLLIGFLIAPAAVADYEVALKLTLPAVFASGPIRQAIFPKISNRFSRGESIVPDVDNARSFTSIFAVPLFFGALALSDQLVVTVYGGDYRGAGALLVGLALYRILDTQSQVQIRTLEAIDRPDAVFRASAVTLTFNVALGVVLLLEYGAIGAVVATVLAELLRYGIVTYWLRDSLSGVGYLTREVGNQFVAGGVMFVAVLGLERLVGEWSWYVLLAVVGTGAAVYFLALLAVSRKLRVTARAITGDFLDAS